MVEMEGKQYKTEPWLPSTPTPHPRQHKRAMDNDPMLHEQVYLIKDATYKKPTNLS